MGSLSAKLRSISPTLSLLDHVTLTHKISRGPAPSERGNVFFSKGSHLTQTPLGQKKRNS